MNVAEPIYFPSQVKAGWESPGFGGRVWSEDPLMGVWGNPSDQPAPCPSVLPLRGGGGCASALSAAVCPSARSAECETAQGRPTHMRAPCLSSVSVLCPSKHMTLPAVPVAWTGRPPACGLQRGTQAVSSLHTPALSRRLAFSLRSP